MPENENLNEASKIDVLFVDGANHCAKSDCSSVGLCKMSMHADVKCNMDYFLKY